MSHLLLYPSRPTRVHKLDLIRRQNPETWRLQLKFNGHHMIVSTHEPDYMHSRHGVPLTSAIGTDFSTECMKIFGLDCIFDGELCKIKGKLNFIIWDVPVWRGKDLTQEMYATRLAILSKYWSDFKETGRIRVRHNVWIAGIYTLSQLDSLILHCDKKLIEGVVAKDLRSTMAWSRVGQMECTRMLKYRV